MKYFLKFLFVMLASSSFINVHSMQNDAYQHVLLKNGYFEPANAVEEIVKSIEKLRDAETQESENTLDLLIDIYFENVIDVSGNHNSLRILQDLNIIDNKNQMSFIVKSVIKSWIIKENDWYVFNDVPYKNKGLKRENVYVDGCYISDR